MFKMGQKSVFLCDKKDQKRKIYTVRIIQSSLNKEMTKSVFSLGREQVSSITFC
jgi:hypothetical protein